MDLANLNFFGGVNCYELFSMSKNNTVSFLKSKDQEEFRKFIGSRTPNPFFEFNDKLFFYKMFADTIFSVTEREVENEYILKFRERAIPSGFWKKYSKYSEKEEALQKENLAYFFGRFFENPRFLSIVYRYQGNDLWFIFDKKNRNQINSLSIRLEKYDLNFFPPFQFFENGFFYYIPARTFKSLVRDHANPDILPYRFKEVAKSLDDDDNPVILKVNFVKH
jgi:hypothetical protein